MLHDSAHERLLERLAAGDSLALEERETVRTCPDCALLDREMGVLQARMDRVGARQREIVAAALAGPRRAAPRPAARLVWLAAAAAVLLALWLAFDRRGSGDGEDVPGAGVYLGDSEIEPLDPEGPVDGFAAFRIRVVDGGAGWYTVEVFGPEGDPRDPILRSPALEALDGQLTWTPTQKQLDELPDEIRWRATHDPGDGGPPVRSRLVSASRSPR
jgi:hypothetical protein